MTYDLGVELTSNKLYELLAYGGTTHQTSCIHLHNRMRLLKKHCYIVENARSLLLSALDLNEFWEEAFLIIVYVINKISSYVTSILSHLEKLYNSITDYSSLKVFGSTYFVLRPQVEHSKLSYLPKVILLL